MKRLLSLLLALTLLSGCGSAAWETEPTFVHITVETLAENRTFTGFTAGPAGDDSSARQLVFSALEQYPPGFADQWGEVQILLCRDLTGTGAFEGDRYAGFTQRTEDGWLMVLDTDRCDTGTVHHEIGHILDGILTDAGVLTEAEWMGFCPGEFSYGTGNFSDYPDFFADAYAMTNIKEDRAGTFETAMLYGPGVYADRPALWLKLECFSRAIRAHFNTEGWPMKTAWEMAL